MPLSDAAFIILPLLVAGALLWGVARVCSRGALAATAAGTAAWMTVTWLLAGRGVFLDFAATPPPFALLVLCITGLAGVLAFSPAGTRLAHGIPLWVLVLVQGFRLPLELAMHALAVRGVMPAQMSYTGRNFDIVTGATAILVALLLRVGAIGRRATLAWNILGLALLANIMAVGILSTPRFRAFGDDALNTFVTSTPYIWLPSVLVLAALAGHLLIFRALRRQAPTR